MKKSFLLLLNLLFFCGAFAQTQGTCGTFPDQNYWETIDAIDPELRLNFPRTETYRYIPIRVVCIGRNDGSGVVSTARILNVLCTLNTNYDSAGIRFYLAAPPTQILNDQYYNVADQTVSDNLMTMFNLDNVCNMYFTDISRLGLCGYAYFPATGPGPNSRAQGGLMISVGCVEGSTITHEMGHYLSLPHPFDGTSGFPASPGVERVTRNPIDTLNGRRPANCNSAGDRFCDTEADFIGNRWACPYTGSQRDVNGDLFRPDQTLYMSYSLDNCQRRFSTQQMSAMNFALSNQRSYLLNPSTTPTGNKITSSTTLLEPINGITNIPRNWARFYWTPVPNATAYHLQVSSTTGFGNIAFETVIYGDTTYLYKGWKLNQGTTYFWRIRPFSGVDYCQGYSANQSFVAGKGYGLAISEKEPFSATIYPNPAKDKQFTISFEETPTNGQVQLFDMTGRLVFTQKIENGFATQTVSIGNIRQGAYFVRIYTSKGMIQKLLSVE